jgi:hypothetical protein
MGAQAPLEHGAKKWEPVFCRSHALNFLATITFFAFGRLSECDVI